MPVINNQKKARIASAAAEVSSTAKSVQTTTNRNSLNWLAGIVQWFAFVNHRRNDNRFSVFPAPLAIVEALAILASAVLFLLFFVDPLILERMQGASTESMPFFRLVTRLGESAWLLYPTGIVLIGATVLSANRFRGKGRFLWHRLVLNAYYLFTAVAFSGLLANLFKNLIGRARPRFTEVGHVWQSMPFHDSYRFASFPSGHATTAGAMAVALALLFPRARVFFLLAGLWIAVSRPALGVHFPSDVLAGFTFGAAFAWFYARAFARKRLLFEYTETGGLKLRGAPGFSHLWKRRA
ncbi:MAG: phosphatase PAP2 family protein [Nitratireductor sp.]